MNENTDREIQELEEKWKKRYITASALSVKDEWGKDTYHVYVKKYKISREDIEDYAMFITKAGKIIVAASAVFLAGYLFQKKD